MLAFFRKYQRYFFIVITVVIVISFSFFGSYNTMQRGPAADKTAFTAVDGSEIGRYELEELVTFIGTDTEDKLLLGGAWGPNFLNDGVIKKDLFQTGLAQILVAPYLGQLRSDLQSRHAREKRYVPYSHPQAKFISSENIWNVLAPDVQAHLKALQAIKDPADVEGFNARVKLFLGERHFPHLALRHVLRLQEKQYNWVSPDPNLDRTDLALFGYHTMNEWFGPRFTRLVAQFIINSAIIAEQRGYEVSKAEALADLYRNAEVSFQQNAGNPNIGVATSSQYFEEQLRRLGMDQSKAVGVWRKVMLFRRLFHDLGNSVLVDPFTIRQFHQYVKETVEGDLYQLPKNLQFGDFRSLQKFEVYLDAVANRPGSGKEMLDLPGTFKSAEMVMEETPELVQRRFLLEVAKIDKKMLYAKVGVKETWAWEVQDKNWEKLKNKFPELGIKKGATEEERFAALDEFDKKMRARVDSFARSEIVDEHPEWLSQTLREVPSERLEMGIRKKGENSVFSGLKNPQELIDLLDQYPDREEELTEFTVDDKTYYRIEVLDRSKDFEVLTYSEADEEGVLDELLDRQLETHYEAIREEEPKKFQSVGGAWKPLNQVRQQVENSYFANALDEINKFYTKAQTPGEKPKAMIGDFAASLRFYPFMWHLREQFLQDPQTISLWIHEPSQGNGKDKVSPREELKEQWKISRTSYKGDRNAKNLPVPQEEAYSLQLDEWSSVQIRPNGEVSFFQLKQKAPANDPLGLYEKVMEVQQFLSVEARQVLMRQLLTEMEAKKALSLKYLNRDDQEEE